MDFVYTRKCPDIKDIIDILPSDGIFLIDNFISDKACDIILRDIEKHAVHDETKFIPNTNVKCLTLDDGVQFKLPCHEYIYTKLVKFGNEMMTRYAIRCENLASIQFRKIYGATNIHRDGHDNTMSRTLSIVLALNDDYEGGEFVFPLQNYKVKLKKGQLIAFPPYWTHPHYTTNLQNDTFRYTINTWFGH